MSIDRRHVLHAGLGLGAGSMFATSAWAQSWEADARYLQDFDEFWHTLAARYCFFAEKTTVWDRVRSRYRPLAGAAQSDDAFAMLLAQAMRELYDPHTHLNDPPTGTPRFPLYDLRVTSMGDVAEVASGSPAAKAGILVGKRILAVDGQALPDLVRALAPRCLATPDPAAEYYVWNAAVAGKRGQARRMRVQGADGTAREVDLSAPWATLPDVEHRRLADGIGLIAIRSFGSDAVVAAFDAALAELRDTRGLILDVRDNGGGDTAVARPIMGRFLTEARDYARMRRREGAELGSPWTEQVEPRGPFTYTGKVAVLVNRWSASMAEGFPMGMRGIGRAVVVGTPMMGLGAAVSPLRLDRTGITLQYSAEPVYDVNDAPRWRMQPDVVVRDPNAAIDTAVAALRR